MLQNIYDNDLLQYIILPEINLQGRWKVYVMKHKNGPEYYFGRTTKKSIKNYWSKSNKWKQFCLDVGTNNIEKQIIGQFLTEEEQVFWENKLNLDLFNNDPNCFSRNTFTGVISEKTKNRCLEELRLGIHPLQGENNPNKTEEGRKRCSDWMKNNNPMNDENILSILSEKAIKKWGDPNSTYNTPEHRQHLSNIMRLRWSDPTSAFNSPDFRKSLSERFSGSKSHLYGKTGDKNIMANPAVKERHRNIMKRKVWVCIGNKEEYITDNLFHFYHIAGWEYGRVISEETMNKHKNRRKITCEHCGLSFAKAMFNRWHRGKCKMNKKENGDINQ